MSVFITRWRQTQESPWIRAGNSRRRRKSERRSMAADMRLPTVQKQVALPISGSGRKDLVVPGDIITSDTGFMRYISILRLL